MNTFIAKSISELNPIANELIKLLKETPVVAFYGEMGAGKTTFIKVLCQQMGVEDEVNSPSFAIINEYRTDKNLPVFHFDLYRLEDEVELLDIGCEEYFDSGDVCLIEWPNKAGSLLPEQRVNLTIEELPDGSRKITILKTL
ncbi:tRNA (adenosine(37)-N6)-threonylcarbamoyltransferase complex ATPase subunit type 1 TsaE [Natronoflexus pectinivorans]|uniref:tRNA threonylcarbamoyladenosine biosynthesis protein TsaE n=1 Tax=Natronoflexus pectinivorans TaxID=682526 RepID=A0A4R2GHT2_9BACT|nr:tRNA (adenosine(37)-N6)-threonylcarbamoyltransferase complex ATPase subunit type 1 TsaE [Natronoflexus pectinivorans]TCO07946.1 tRNA threonylcarbamoyladenosine biosynthesis protein TsaE [Natronoflexus pectinivorans]